VGVNQRQCFLGNRAALDVLERQAQRHAAPALDELVEAAAALGRARRPSDRVDRVPQS
jgi:hypothetical protein